ncbi:response regulator [Sulfurimonas crateris]|uniref:Response regulator n=1 Tax=Sulfurimonas crateris TaxID=2574727 RepID=A0A4U2Z7Y2_9BACT|nr:response regulator [Sulfurimonas crateris]TKI69031.1 response regulator [Sulfurimonas crateris]
MKKIALIEDRYSRQRNFLEQNDINLDEYEEILENFINEKADNLLENIINDSFNLQEFDIVICHKSVENNTVILGNLKDYCKKHQKILVLFSGGISVNYYNNSELELLELNSKIFYSKNLVLFLEAVKADNEDIMMLCYGEKWQQNIVANVFEKTNKLINKIDDKVVYLKFANFVDIKKLDKIDYCFYNLEIENNRTSKSEIEKFRDSLLSYFKKNEPSKKSKNAIKIHHNNVIDIEFYADIEFDSTDDIDTYISKIIINELGSKEFDTIFIKDNLSSNYLELYGLRVAYHIRLSSELGDKRFAPIVIISDFDEATLNRFTHEANILFTEGIYLCKNTKEDIQNYQSLELKGVSNYDMFLSKIEVSPPRDTSGSHGIANKWSIYRWANFLGAKSEAIDKNKDEIENQLYFKYLKALHKHQDNKLKDIIKSTKEGKVLLIDDEWDKGWKDILSQTLTKEYLEFSAFEYDFKDKSNFNLIVQLNYKELKEQVAQSDVVILDLRLIEQDHENDNIENYSGVKILQKIHEINAGIQVIMLTATSKSTILEKLYEKKILGYVKKEHPEDKSIDTIENINKFVSLVDKGLERKYLKEVYIIQKRLLNILSDDIFEQYELQKELYEFYWLRLKNESKYIFDIMDSDTENKFAYAMLSIASSLESILSIFLKERQYDNIFWDKEEYGSKKLEDKLNKLLSKLGSCETYDFYLLIKRRNDYLHANENYEPVSSENITKWFYLLEKVINNIKLPPNYLPYVKKEGKHHNFHKNKDS